MSKMILMAFVGGLMAHTSASAASVTYADTDYHHFGIPKFDGNWGVLQSATLSVTAYKERTFDVFAGSNVQSLEVKWLIEGSYRTDLPPELSSGGSRTLVMPLGGAGSTSIAMYPWGPNSERSYGRLNAAIFGSMSYELDLNGLTGSGFNPGSFQIYGFDTGYSSGGDATVTGQGLTSFRQLPGTCGLGGLTGEDFCGNVIWRVTYNYIAYPGVPEPTTWAMLILGFGMVGGAMRRKLQPARMIAQI